MLWSLSHWMLKMPFLTIPRFLSPHNAFPVRLFCWPGLTSITSTPSSVQRYKPSSGFVGRIANSSYNLG